MAVARPVGRLLSYSAPSDLGVAAGMRVLVPLGSSRTTGMVMRTQSCGDADCFAPSLRSSIRDLYSTPHSLKPYAAMRWYRSEPADVLKAALPAGTNVGTVKTLVRNPDHPLPLEFFYLEPEFDNEASVAASSLDDQALARLIKSGAVTAQTELAPPKPEPQVEWVRAQRHPDDFPKRAKAQRQLLEELYLLGGWQPLSALTRRRGMRRLLRALVDKEAIEISWRAWVDQSLTPRDEAPKLNPQQQRAVDAIGEASGFEQHLIFGITGSGRTEVYLQAIACVLARGQQALVLVPEIALTPQMVRRFAAAFGDQIAVLHSALR